MARVGTFEQPVLATAIPGTDQTVVVEKTGRVRVATGMTCSAPDTCPTSPVTAGRVALDISSQVSSGTEQGLLGLAFHPDWPDDPRIFIDFTDRTGATHIEAWNWNGPAAHATRARELLEIVQPFANHNGGNLVFGPRDGLLYIGMGDGGSAGDPGDRAQDPEERLGKILRIDVDGGGARGYAIPRGNLAPDSPAWALGLRNPWRFSFDHTTGDLWIGDVGQNAREEIDAVPAADVAGSTTLNFGWRRREGFRAYDASGRTGPGRLTAPLLDYGRDDGCSVTGGYVYRGHAIPKLRGWFVFADYCAKVLRFVPGSSVRTARHQRGAVRFLEQRGAGQISSFGEGLRRELLVTTTDGGVYQVVAAS
jgi:glucose/arabinose dehydrogenase